VIKRERGSIPTHDPDLITEFYKSSSSRVLLVKWWRQLVLSILVYHWISPLCLLNKLERLYSNIEHARIHR
jgi:hypothetical protein